MIEGEFKKRLENMEARADGTLVQEMMKIWLDEARREYPSMASLGLVPKLSEYDIDKIDTARNEWFVKWFGDEK